MIFVVEVKVDFIDILFDNDNAEEEEEEEEELPVIVS